jgi:hypothetical protein
MVERPADRIETVFEEYGSLPKPGFMGRLVRLGFGVWLLWVLYILITDGWQGFVDTTPPTHWTMWAFIGFAFLLTPYVINIGFTRNWKRRPQIAIALTGVLLMAIDLALYGSWWAPPLGAFVWAWLAYFAAHLGFSFVLSALIATPGCEMRSIPHLWTLITGRETKEHYCPGIIDMVDRWEAGGSSTGRSAQ